jgi:3-oxoacyl-[acyl-carrier protein] reductase
MNTQTRCVVVTGGSRGLGLALVLDLLERGYSVATCSRTASEPLMALIARYGEERLMWQPCDVGNGTDEERYFSEVDLWSGARPLYGLVNNAGVAAEGILATFPAKDTGRIIAVNLLGAIQMSRLALRRLLANRGGGRIVNISSIIGSRGYTGLAAYSASKAGLDGLTRALAREVGRRAITVNSVAPGYLETEMSASLAPRQQQQIVNRTPLGRLGAVADVTPVVCFLLSDEARFITGQTLTVDGGVTC